MKLYEVVELLYSLLTLNYINKSLEVKILLSHFANVNSKDFIINPNLYIPIDIVDILKKAVQKRNTNYPIAYIVGYKYFWDDKFIVNENVLIPRPETEFIISTALEMFKEKNNKFNFLDIGTGSGCIILSLLKEYRKAEGLGVDISKKALKVAKLNADNLKLKYRCEFIESKLFMNINDNKKYDLIVSNPPYVVAGDKNIDSSTFYEPKEALYAINDGLFFYEEIFKYSKSYLKYNGIIIIEIGYNQKNNIMLLANKYKLNIIKTIKDYSNIDRIVVLKYI